MAFSPYTFKITNNEEHRYEKLSTRGPNPDTKSIRSNTNSNLTVDQKNSEYSRNNKQNGDHKDMYAYNNNTRYREHPVRKGNRGYTDKALTGDTHGKRVAIGSVGDCMDSRKYHSEYKASHVRDQRQNKPYMNNQRSDKDLTWRVKKSSSDEHHTNREKNRNSAPINQHLQPRKTAAMLSTIEFKGQQQRNFIESSGRNLQALTPAAASADNRENHQLQTQNDRASLDCSENKESQAQIAEQHTDKNQRQQQKKFTELPNREHQSLIPASASPANSVSQQLHTQMEEQQASKT